FFVLYALPAASPPLLTYTTLFRAATAANPRTTKRPARPSIAASRPVTAMMATHAVATGEACAFGSSVTEATPVGPSASPTAPACQDEIVSAHRPAAMTRTMRTPRDFDISAHSCLPSAVAAVDSAGAADTAFAAAAARSTAAALFSDSRYSVSGTESATMPPPA